MKWFEVDRKLQAAGFKVFTDREFRAVAGGTSTAANFMLMRYARRGLLCRLKRGLYAAESRMPSPWFIANQLYKPSYVSLEAALSYYGLIPESVYALTSVTTKSTREFEAAGKAYVYRTIRKAAFTGYRSVAVGDETVMMAEPEKAAADHLYFAFLRKEAVNDRLALDRIDRGKLLDHIKRFTNPRMLWWFNHDFTVPDRRTAR